MVLTQYLPQSYEHARQTNVVVGEPPRVSCQGTQTNKCSDNMSLLGHVIKIVSILLSKLSDCPNTDTSLCYCNYPHFYIDAGLSRPLHCGFRCHPEEMQQRNTVTELDMSIYPLLTIVQVPFWGPEINVWYSHKIAIKLPLVRLCTSVNRLRWQNEVHTPRVNLSLGWRVRRALYYHTELTADPTWAAVNSCTPLYQGGFPSAWLWSEAQITNWECLYASAYTGSVYQLHRLEHTYLSATSAENHIQSANSNLSLWKAVTGAAHLLISHHADQSANSLPARKALN